MEFLEETLKSTMRTPERSLRSFGSTNQLAEAMPNLSTVRIRWDNVASPTDYAPFEYFGQYVEQQHGKHSNHGFIRNTRLFERDSRKTLAALINGDEDVATAKETIVQNELACEIIHHKAKPLVEVLDYYTTQRLLEACATEASEDFAYEAFSHGSTLGKKELARLSRTERDLYTTLVALEETFATFSVGVLAGYLALDLPLVDMDLPAHKRVEAMADVNFEQRFNKIVRTLHGNPDTKILHSVRCPRNSYPRFVQYIKPELREVDIPEQTDVPPDQRPGGSLPLLDIPSRHTPRSISEIAQHSPEKKDSHMLDVYSMYPRFGCVLTSSEDYYALFVHVNPFAEQQPAGATTYLQELFESIMSAGVIDQLLHQSKVGVPEDLTCLFCGIEHDPRYGRCSWNKQNGVWRVFLNLTSSSRWPHAKNWVDYLGVPTPVLETFVATDVPGQDELLALRTARQAG